MTTPVEQLQADLQEAISKHLPSTFSGVLKQELQALEALRLSARKWQEEKEKQIELTKEVAQENLKLKEENARLTKQHADFEARLTAVLLREVKQDVVDMELKMMREHVSGMFALVGSVFKGPVWQRKVEGFVPVPLPGVPASGTPAPYHNQIPPSVGSGGISMTDTVSS